MRRWFRSWETGITMPVWIILVESEVVPVTGLGDGRHVGGHEDGWLGTAKNDWDWKEGLGKERDQILVPDFATGLELGGINWLAGNYRWTNTQWHCKNDLPPPSIPYMKGHPQKRGESIDWRKACWCEFGQRRYQETLWGGLNIESKERGISRNLGREDLTTNQWGRKEGLH